jgi:hypothetical protein
MRAKTHPGDEKHTETSSSEETMGVEEMKQRGMNERQEADRELNPAGVSVKDVADQSAYEDNELEIAHQAANSGRDKK